MPKLKVEKVKVTLLINLYKYFFIGWLVNEKSGCSAFESAFQSMTLYDTVSLVVIERYFTAATVYQGQVERGSEVPDQVEERT